MAAGEESAVKPLMGRAKKRWVQRKPHSRLMLLGRAGPPCFHELAEDERLRIHFVQVNAHLRPSRLGRGVSFVRAEGVGSGRCSTDWVLPWEFGSKKGVRWRFSGGGVALKWGRERSYHAPWRVGNGTAYLAV